MLRVLTLHNSYQNAGGEDAVVASEGQLLERMGNPYRLLTYSSEELHTGWQRASAAMGAVYSRKAAKRLRDELDAFRPDVVHVHNFVPLWSPAVHMVCRARHIPVVQTLHNFRLACPNGLLMREGRPCEDCLDKPFAWPGVLRACYRSSRAQTAVVATVMSAHRARGTWRDSVDAYVALTEFQRTKLVRWGLPADRIHVKPNFTFGPERAERIPGEPFVLFVGRLSQEKGIRALLDAYLASRVTAPLVVVGEGPLREELERTAAAAGVTDRVTFRGRLPGDEVGGLMARASVLAVPSLCYEGFPVAVAEAFAHGLPVLASRLGSLPEIVEAGRTGWLAGPEDAVEWSQCLREALSNADVRQVRGRAARERYEALYSPEANYRRLIAIYEHAGESAAHAGVRPNDSGT